jgi:hypothetical protein
MSGPTSEMAEYAHADNGRWIDADQLTLLTPLSPSPTRPLRPGGRDWKVTMSNEQLTERESRALEHLQRAQEPKVALAGTAGLRSLSNSSRMVTAAVRQPLARWTVSSTQPPAFLQCHMTLSF